LSGLGVPEPGRAGRGVADSHWIARCCCATAT